MHLCSGQRMPSRNEPNPITDRILSVFICVHLWLILYWSVATRRRQSQTLSRPRSDSGSRRSTIRWIWSGWRRVLKCEAMITSFSNRSARAMQVVEVRVAELVDQRRALVGGDEGHLEDQDLGLVDLGAGVEALGRGVAQVGDLGQADLGRDLDAGEPQVADLLAGQVVVLGLELLPPLPDEEAERGDACAWWRRP